MILSTHAIVGATVAQFFPDQPALAFGMAVASHYLVDLIPHREYSVNFFEKVQFGKHEVSTINFKNWHLSDTLKVALDLAFGLGVAGFLFWYSTWPILILGILGGILPDTIRFFKPLRRAEIMHEKVHYHKKWSTNVESIFIFFPEVLLDLAIILTFWR